MEFITAYPVYKKGWCFLCKINRFLFLLVFLLSLFLQSCISTPKVSETEEDSTTTTSESTDTGSGSFPEDTEDHSAIRTERDGKHNPPETDKSKTGKSKTSSIEDNPNPLQILGINFSSNRENPPGKEESYLYIFFYTALFTLIYLFIILKIIRRQQRK